MRLRERFNRSERRPSTRNQRIGFAFFWLIVVSLAYVIPSAPSFNTESHLYVAYSVVDHHTLNIDAYHRRLGDESYYRGHYFSDKAPGLSLLAVPAYQVFRWAFPAHKAEQYFASGKSFYGIPSNTTYIRYALTYVLLIVPAALFAVLLWLFYSMFIPSGWALFLAGGYALGTTARVYSMWYFSHQVCAILLFGAFILLFAQVRNKAASRRALLCAATAGVMTGYAVISEYPTVVIAGLLFGYTVATAGNRLRAGAAFLCGLIPPALAGIEYNVLAFGRPLSTGYNYVNSSMYHHSIAIGVLGLGNPASYGVQAPTWNTLWQITFGSYRGIFLVCPILVLFFPGVAAMYRHRELRREVLLCALVVVAYFLMDAARPADINGWSGGASIASRHLVPVLPFMVFPIVFLANWTHGRLIVATVNTASLGIMTAIAVSPHVRGFDIGDPNPLVHELWSDVTHGRVELNWGQMLGLTGAATLLPLAAILGCLLLRLVWLHRLRSPVAAQRPGGLTATARP